MTTGRVRPDLHPDHPADERATARDRRAKEREVNELRAEIERYGWALQYVLDEDDPALSYGYTAGLVLRGLPELVVSGLAPQPAWTVLEDVAAQATAGRVPRPGELLRGAPDETFRVREADEELALPAVRDVVGRDAPVRVLHLCPVAARVS